MLRATLATFCGNALAVHDVYGLSGPSGNRFCRMCLITRAELLNSDVLPDDERTAEVFANHLTRIRNACVNIRTVETDTGVRSDSALHDSRFFRIYDNNIFDIVHDVLLGVGPLTLKLIIDSHVFVDLLYSVPFLNDRISAFNYGILERKNKPSANLISTNIRNVVEHTLGQKAMQMWCFLRIFPFLVSDKVHSWNRHMRLLLQLLNVMEIIFAPKLTRGLTPLLSESIKDFL